MALKWLLGFVLVLAIVVAVWAHQAASAYSAHVRKPGEVYRIGEREYRAPEVPILGATPYNLKEPFLVKLRELYQKTSEFLDQEGLEWWVTGGTLIGFLLHGAVSSPSDDDVDLGTHVSNREKLDTPEFAARARKAGVETRFLFFYSRRHATKESAACRFSLRGHRTPVLDVFFYSEAPRGRFAKIDTWTNYRDFQFSTREIYDRDLMFPLQRRTIDDLTVPMPAQPEKVLQHQYGPKVLERDVVRETFISHEGVYNMLPFIWRYP